MSIPPGHGLHEPIQDRDPDDETQTFTYADVLLLEYQALAAQQRGSSSTYQRLMELAEKIRSHL